MKAQRLAAAIIVFVYARLQRKPLRVAAAANEAAALALQVPSFELLLSETAHVLRNSKLGIASKCAFGSYVAVTSVGKPRTVTATAPTTQ